MTNKIMTTSEFLEIMAENASEFPEFAALSQENKEQIASLNINTGVAEAFYDGDRLIGVGGIRLVGEAWMLTRRDIRAHPDRSKRRLQFEALLALTKKVMLRMMKENNLWRVFATGKLSVTFLEKLGFEKEGNILVWTKK